MGNRKNRKKEYKLSLKRQGLIKTADEKIEDTLQVVPSKSVISKSNLSLEEFSAISAVEGIRANLIETLYNEGIQSIADFKTHSEEEVLAFKGIGPATISKLKENGVHFR